MFQKFGRTEKGLRTLKMLLPWCLLIVLLSGCGSSLWQVGGLALEEDDHLQQLLSSGWTLGQGQAPLSVLLWQLLAGTVPENPYQQLAGGFPVLQEEIGKTVRLVTEEEAFYASAFVSDSWKHRFEKVSNITVSDDVQVVLYHTHNAETYLPTYGVSKVNGQNGGVVQAAEVFQAALQQKYGIRTIHSTTLHDYPNWNRSYQNSLSTAKTLLQANPQTKAIFDVHRDAGFSSKDTTTATINGRKAARIMLVVGANQPNWKENLAFARQLEAKCNELYPELLRNNIHLKETGRYNQQVHPHAVLLEIGSDLNTQEEANYAMECFAQVVYEVLQSQE